MRKGMYNGNYGFSFGGNNLVDGNATYNTTGRAQRYLQRRAIKEKRNVERIRRNKIPPGPFLGKALPRKINTDRSVIQSPTRKSVFC
jgi:hypothetical protein